MRQQQGVALALPERRDVDGDLADAVEQIFAEAALFDQAPQVLMGGAHHAHIDRDFFTPAEALDYPLLQKTQQLGLQRKRQIAYFVQKQGAVVGVFDLALGLFARAGERAFFIAE